MPESPKNQATVNPHDAVTLAATRYWQERAKGRAVSVDDVLDTPISAPDYLATRATAIGLIAKQAAERSGGGEVAASERPTVASPSGNGGLGGSLGGGVVNSGPLPQIEGYDLVACLGRGGMGAVFEGYQQSTGRRVAVKFMLEGFDRSESMRKRFEREVEVVARLNHPGIVSVVDSGVRRGRYYYVMEFVAGRSLEVAFKPGQCEPARALELVAQVCDAIDYAHQHGVLHRDLKPSNIIVDDQGLPRLLDFGLAKTFDPGADGARPMERNLTVSGPDQLLGTIGYMSPEQAAGRHDEASVRTDVYSLGSIAYELLTGRLPCPLDGSLREVLNRISQEDPPAPSALRRKRARSGSWSRAAGAADTDSVLLKALEKNPDRRYATAGELAADIRRLLAGEPVSARRIGLVGRSWRWVNRHRAISAVIASAVLALAVVSSLLVLRIVKERDQARQNFSLLRGILESVNPASGGKMTVAQLLDGAASSLDASPPEQPLAEAEIRELLGNVYTKDGEYQKAITHLKKTVQILEASSASRENRALAEALHKLGVAYWWNGDYTKAEETYQRSLDIRLRLHKGDDAEVALSLTHLAACRLRLGKLDESRELYQRALDIRQRLYRGVNNGDHEEIAQALNALAKCFLELQQYARAEELFRQALEMIRRLRGDSFEGTAATSQNLGDCLLRRHEAARLAGETPEAGIAAAAEEAMDRALSIRKTIYPDGHHLVATSMIGLSRAELTLGHRERALELATNGLKMYRDRRRSDHPEYAEALRALAAAQCALGDHAAASRMLEEALGVAAAARPPAPGQVTRIRRELALALIGAGDRVRAAGLLGELFASLRALGAAGATEARQVARELADLYAVEGREDLARPYRDFITEHP